MAYDWNLKNCQSCGAEFSIFRWQKKCSECGIIICRDCVEYFLAQNRCSKCTNIAINEHNEYLDRLDRVLIVRSSHIGKHKIIEDFGAVETFIESEDQDEVIDDLKHAALEKNGNAIVDFRLIPHKHKKGNYIYKEWTGSGRIVLVEKL